MPGNLGQAWLGSSATQFVTITSASVVLRNDLETRSREFGSSVPAAICPGQRSVTAAFDLYSQDDEATKALYQAARQQSPITVMLQLGEVEGQVMGVYLKSVIPEVPEFDDSENRLQWRFRASRAQGTDRRRDLGGVRMTYESNHTDPIARAAPGVSFTVARMSFGRRVDLMRRVRELARRMEFLEASREPGEKMDAGLLRAEIDRLYVEWGLRSVSGLQVDGEEATPEPSRRSRARRSYSAKRLRRFGQKRASPRLNEKTNRRLPLSVFQPGRLEVRRVPEDRPGE